MIDRESGIEDRAKTGLVTLDDIHYLLERNATLLKRIGELEGALFELQDKMSVALYVINGLENLDLQKRVTANQLIQFFRENEHLLKSRALSSPSAEGGGR